MSPAQPRLLIDPYLDWVAAEGLPVHEDFGVDLLSAETAPWPRLGERCNGAFVHLKGRGDWMTVFLLEVPPGGQSAPQQHLFDELFYVLSGSGSTVIELPGGGRHAFERRSEPLRNRDGRQGHGSRVNRLRYCSRAPPLSSALFRRRCTCRIAPASSA